MANPVAPVIFNDLDDAAHYQPFENAVLDPNTNNFVIEFDDQKGQCALDVDQKGMRHLLYQKRPTKSVKWISIFAPNRQKEVIMELTIRYRLSPRLAGLMMSDPEPLRNVEEPTSPTATLGHHRFSFHKNDTHAEIDEPDLEMDYLETSLNNPVEALGFNHYKLVNEVWHWSSTDFGPRYLCIGYNSLTNVGSTSDEAARHSESKGKAEDYGLGGILGKSNLPKGKRLWSWLLLCDDGTIISIYEDPYPRAGRDQQKEEVRILRRNLLTVVRQLSKVQVPWREKNPVAKFDIRPNLKPKSDSKLSIKDSSGLLFYYIFDDWFTSYALVAKREQQYAQRLQNLRSQMFGLPNVELVNGLHQAGRQLAVLKRMYQSYTQIITRILEKQKQFAKRRTQERMQSRLAADLRSSGEQNHASEMQSEGEDERLLLNELYGIPLPQAVLFRFERLLDRINLYALSEIQECLDEKNDLVFLNFNLITLKESSAIEKLTRITILLAKATILFLPVSLMTGYFSTQIQDLQNIYTAKTYWVSFAVIFFLSFLFLFVFGLISGTVEGTVVYRSFTRLTLDRSKQAYKGSRGAKTV